MSLSNYWKAQKQLWNGVDIQEFMSGESDSDDTRTVEYKIALSLLDGRQDDILESDIRQSYRPYTAKNLTKCMLTFNIVARIVNKLAMLYREAPEFTCESNPALVEAIKDITSSLKTADRVSEVCGLAWLYIEYDPITSNLDVIAIPPDRITPEYHPYDASRLVKVTLYSQAKEGKDVKQIRTVWTDSSFNVYEGKKDITDKYLSELGKPENPNRENPYGVLPFVPLYSKRPYYDDPYGYYREDLVTIQRQINLKLSDLMYLMKMQAFGQLVAINAEKKDIEIGPDSIICLDGTNGTATPDAKYIYPNAPIEAIWNSLKEMIHYAAFIHNLSGQWTEGGAIPSGEALKVVNADLTEYREDKEDTHSWCLKNLATTAAIIAKVHGIGTGTAEDFSIEFGDPEAYIDPRAEADTWIKLIQNGIYRRTDWVKAEHGMTDEEATAYLNNALTTEKSNAQAQRMTPPNPADFLSKGMPDSNMKDNMNNTGK